ncbi:single hybrid motif-containing protein [Collybia nuda]|uniref:Single hybrid motif-containing protein n=1 Tax=Collybia nuda TaxID=64659 RepID=A0A9P6CHI7_9AGAR|nr:single hybrid motif-containing protein [Collybia nuda]
MNTVALNSLSKSTTRSPLFAGAQSITSQARKRWLHQSPARQAIIMPAMSPFMTEGTITRWKKREGESFAVGDVLLQIESDIATIDVEAQNPGILGKILTPDGTTNVPVEQVIALVVKDTRDLADMPVYDAAPLSYNPLSSPTIPRGVPSPLRVEKFNQPLTSPARRSPSLFEKQMMGHSLHLTHARGISMRHARGQHLNIVPPSPQIDIQVPFPSITLPTSRVQMSRPKTALGTDPPDEKLVRDQPI